MSYQKMEIELVSNTHQSEQGEQDMLTQKIKKDNERFEKMVTIRDKIQYIKKNLHKLIQSMNNTPGWLSRAAIFWHEIPLWKKITAGAVLTLPLLLIGIMTNLTAFITLGLVNGIMYTISDILLENHQKQNTNNTENLKEGISSLVDLFDTVISTLDLLREQLAIEIDAFQKENRLLHQQVAQFDEQIKTLQSEINELNETGKALHERKIELEHTVTTLKSAMDEQSQILENTQKQLVQVEQGYKENQNQLSDKIKELADIKVKMEKEVEQARHIGLVLSGTVESFSNITIQNEEQRAAFHKRLEDFLTNKEKSFVEIADRICDAERKLSLVTKQLEESEQRYRKLLDRQEQQIIRLEEIEALQPEGIPESFDEIKPSIHGFYAAKKESPLLSETAVVAALMTEV